MSLVRTPLPSGQHGAAPAGATVRAMEIGQHLIAAALTAIGTIRAIGDGTPPTVAVIAGLAILAWHAAGAVIPSRTTTRGPAAWWLIGLAVLWGGAVCVSPEFVWLAFLLWLLAGHLLPLGWGLLFSAAVLAVAVGAPVVHHGTATYATALGPLLGCVFAYGISRGYLQLLRDASERERLVDSLTRAQREMAELQDELATAVRHSGALAERTRIARDLHDTVAQSLSSIRLLSHAEANRADLDTATRTLDQAEALAGDSLADVRRIVAALAPSELEDDALAAALRRMLDRAREETGIDAELVVDESLPQLPTEVEVALLRTAQSALANVRLHADAARVVVSLIDADDAVRLDIIDDGCGFDAAAWERAGAQDSSSYGLRFMRARLRELGGGLDVESVSGEGTALSAHLPIRPGTEPGTEQSPGPAAGPGPAPDPDPGPAPEERP